MIDLFGRWFIVEMIWLLGLGLVWFAIGYRGGGSPVASANAAFVMILLFGAWSIVCGIAAIGVVIWKAFQ